MAKTDLTSTEWRDLVFNGKNRAYGAYVLRAQLARRYNIAVAMALLVAATSFCLPALLKKTEARPIERMTEVVVLSRLEEPEIRQEEMKRPVAVAPAPPALKSTVKFTAPVVKKDEEVNEAEEIKSQEELTESKAAISIADVKGNDEIHGQDIADLKEIPVQASEIKAEQILDMAEQMPFYPGGTSEMMRFISKNLKYPRASQENGVQGRVTCQFVVEADGQVRHVKVLRGIAPDLDQEAVRVLSLMPRWIPGKQNGQPVAVKYTVPILFRLQ